jgi:F0F1-type ATP synthase assembly protein I
MAKKRFIIDAATLGIYIAVSVCIGLLGGSWLDGKLHTGPLFLILGFAAGVTAAGLEVWRIVKRSSKEGED